MEKVKITYWDGDNPDVYYNAKKLSEKEIVDLLVKYMEEKHKIIDKIDEYLIKAELDIDNGIDFHIKYVTLGDFIRILKDIKGEKNE